MNPSLFFEQVRSRRVSPEALDWLADGFARHERDGGALSLETCLRLPTATQRRRDSRDYWISQAARTLEAGGSRDVVRDLAKAASDFITRGPWLAASVRSDAHPQFTQLQSELFYLAKALDGRAIPCERQLARILDKTSE